MSIRSLPIFPLASQFRAAQAYSHRLHSGQPGEDSFVRLQRLSAVWSDCIQDIPYYRELVRAGEAPREIASWDDFRHIPVLDRRILQERAADFVRESGPPDSMLSTAGSTGQPVQFGQWRAGMEPVRIAKLVPWIRLGYTLNDPLYLIWGHAHLLGSGWRRYYNHGLRKAKDWIAGYRRVDAYRLDPKKAEGIAAEIIRMHPAGLIGYSAVLDLLCRYTEPYHADLRKTGLKFVMPCAEPPPRDDTFDLLRSVFGCPIVQEFGGVDFGHVGFKIDSAPYTLFPDLNILEAEANSDDASTGAALVTTLYRRYVPLIRYRQGDLITGIRLDSEGLVYRFDEQIGRINDMVRLAGDIYFHSVALVHCFKDEPAVFNVQLVLRDSGPSFSLAVQQAISDRVEDRIRKRLGQLHPDLARAPFEYVRDLETNRAGKRRWVLDLRTRPR